MTSFWLLSFFGHKKVKVGYGLNLTRSSMGELGTHLDSPVLNVHFICWIGLFHSNHVCVSDAYLIFLRWRRTYRDLPRKHDPSDLSFTHLQLCCFLYLHFSRYSLRVCCALATCSFLILSIFSSLVSRFLFLPKSPPSSPAPAKWRYFAASNISSSDR